MAPSFTATATLLFQFVLILSSLEFLIVNALPVFDADVAANPFVHDVRMNDYYERRKTNVDIRAMMMEDHTF